MSPVCYHQCMGDVTEIFEAIRQGDSNSTEELLPLVYDHLRNLAAKKLAGESAAVVKNVLAMGRNPLRFPLTATQSQPARGLARSTFG